MTNEEIEEGMCVAVKKATIWTMVIYTGLMAAPHYPTYVGLVTGDLPPSAVQADVAYLQETMDARMMALPTVAPGVMKALGVEAILFADDHVEIEVPAGFDIRMSRLHEIADDLVDYAGVIGFDPDLFDTLIARGEAEAKLGLWSIDQLADAAEALVDMSNTLDNRARFSVSYMNGNAFSQQEAIDFTALTMKTLMPASVTQDKPTLFDSIFHTRASEMHVEVTEIWGDLGARFDTLSWIADDREMTAEAVVEVSDGPAF